MHKTSAWPLALIYGALVVYASLYPFTQWRDQGVAVWAFLVAPLPRYWTGFDATANALGYVPLGFLLALAALRSGQTRWAVLRASATAAALSLLMEGLQAYLPTRVPSNLDLALNVGGALFGATTASGLERLGLIDRWNAFRSRWFIEESRGALVLLALWPMALLFPPAVPLGLGQVLERLEPAVVELLADTPFLEWLPLREVELQPLTSTAELLCVALGAMVPCLLGFTVLRTLFQRAGFVVVAMALGLAASALSAALSYGPEHAWNWLNIATRTGWLTGLVLALLLLPLSRRSSAGLLLLVLGIHLGLLNQSSASAYFAQTLQTWEQGRFIRFHGLAQWLGWLWPYVTLLYLLVKISQPDTDA